MLLDTGQEMLRRVVLGEHNSLAKQGTYLGAADIEHIGDVCHIFQRHIAAGDGQCIAKTCAVHEQRHVVRMRHVGNGLQFGLGVDGAVFGALRDVYGTGEHHVLVVAVRIEGLAEFVQFGRIHLAVVVGNREYLMAGELDGAGLMHVRMAGRDRDHACIRRCDGIDDDLVGLCATYQEPHVRIRLAASLANLRLGLFGKLVGAITRIQMIVGFGQGLQYGRVGSAGVIVLKRQHDGPLCPWVW